MALIDRITRTNFVPTKLPTRVPAEKVNEIIDFLNTYAPNGTLAIDTIAEQTAGNGIVIDSVTLKDGAITTTGINKRSCDPALTAHAGGTKAAGLALTKDINIITVCATLNDSVLLPTPEVGAEVIVGNLGAAGCAVYGSGTTTIDDILTANPFMIYPEEVIVFRAYTTT
ncbi:MAG: hypothetical protein PHY08_14035, partial [Candidatus Cloacimonetes bacterium]|nr:hypothetical protein [Candidatus Cloacimonadota bacterium]